MKSPRVISELCCIGAIKRHELDNYHQDTPEAMWHPPTGIVFPNAFKVADPTTPYFNTMAYWDANARTEALAKCQPDDARRAAQFSDIFSNSPYPSPPVVADVGAGLGGFFTELRRCTPIRKSSLYAVERNEEAARGLAQLGYKVLRDLQEREVFSIITMFHSLEHFPRQLDILRRAHNALLPGGRLIIEVPHGKDALLSYYHSEPFIKWTCRLPDHYVLHTAESLRALLQHVGFVAETIYGYQRYPLANHLYWLMEGKPGGHVEWADSVGQAPTVAYESWLKRNFLTDTLIAVATKPGTAPV